MSSGPSERDLVLLLRRRHPGAFDVLFARYKDRTWRFLVRLSRRADLAEDLFQDTWLAAARNAHRLREGTQLAAWLFTIARNKHRNSLRFLAMDQRKCADLQATPPSPQSPLDESAESRRQAARVAACFDRLPIAHREVLLLALVEGLETRAIALVLGLSEPAVRKRLSRARAELAHASGIEYGGEDPR